MLRLDPNVILVGEMRDLETASIGVQAALTGHLVLSTVHANSATQTVARFVDLGVEPFTVAAALQGVISQRLVRRICEYCRENYDTNPDELTRVGFGKGEFQKLYRGKGCQHCHDTGYRGRLPILELLVIQDDMRQLIKGNIDPAEIYSAARERGMMSIRENALQKVVQGLTTVDEVLRILGPQESDAGNSGAQKTLKVA